jgi:radical SAM-linked protein
MRLRITFSKTGALRYTGHLDLHRIWERTCRRADIPLSYSQGFHPQPRISLAAALPLGFIGQAEVLDLWLDHDEDMTDILKRLQEAAPSGLILRSIQSIKPSQAALQTQVLFADYEVILLDPMDASVLAAKLKQILASKTLLRQRRNRDYDLRPLISSLEIDPSNDSQQISISMRLSASAAATGRPEEVLSELGIKFEDTRITRTKLILTTNYNQREIIF